MKNILYIYPSARAIRVKKQEFLEQNSFLPKMLTVADFESRVITTPYKMVDTLHRTLFLKEASSKDDFNRLYIQKSLVKFYTQSDDFFKFFEELSFEGVSLKDLFLADSYAEFSTDLELLEKLLNNYKNLLLENGFIDRAFLPEFYKINWDYIDSFDGFVFNLEGFLTKFELELFNTIAQKKPFIIKLRATEYNRKILKEFKNLNIELKKDYIYEFDLSTKEILKEEKKPLCFKDVEVYETKEPLEQLAIAFAKIEEFVKDGIEPSKIALILPNEDIAKVIDEFDRLNNFNFAMGKPFRFEESYIYLEQLYEFLKGSKVAKEFLTFKGFDFDLLKELDLKIDIEEFFTKLKELKLPLYSSEEFLEELDNLNLLRKYYNFLQVFRNYNFKFKEWLFFWLDILKKHTLDDVAGGKVTALGVLETRGVSFDAVVVLDFNEGVVPRVLSKDRFLNSSVRKFAKLPTISDREDLQKHYYARVLERAKRAVVTYVSSDEESASKFLYELKLNRYKKRLKVDLDIFYSKDSFYNPKAHLNDVEVEFNPQENIWSSSKLKTFLECKRKFFYKYILKIEEAISKEESDGSILHATLAKLFRNKREFNSVEELKKAFLIELDGYSKDLSFSFKSRLWAKMVEGFLDHQFEHLNSGWKIVELEKRVDGEILGLKFTGRVDRVDKKGNEFLVIDYKSSNSSSINSKNIDKLNDFQMIIYKKIMNLPGINTFAYLDILNSKGFTHLSLEEEKEQKLLEYIEYLKEQKSLVASRCDDLQLCRYCSYQLMCHRGDYL